MCTSPYHALLSLTCLDSLQTTGASVNVTEWIDEGQIHVYNGHLPLVEGDYFTAWLLSLWICSQLKDTKGTSVFTFSEHNRESCLKLILETLSYFFFFWLLWVFVVACGGSSLGEMHGLRCPVACKILVPQPGIEPAYPALKGGFLTTGLPGKPLSYFISYQFSSFSLHYHFLNH